MTERAVEKLTGRMYKQHIKSNGGLPSAKQVRTMEKKAEKIATTHANKERGRR